MINYHNKKFKPISNTENGETSSDTLFEYHQNEKIVWAIYSGGKIKTGQLLGLVDHEGNIEMRYQQINTEGVFMTGICHSKPEIMSSGKIRLHESWSWTSGDFSSGQSVIEEI
jgi:hypothetical protein